jgi:hypothetical protein
VPFAEFDAGAALTNAIAFDIAALVGGHWGMDPLPKIDALYYSADASLAVEVFQAPQLPAPPAAVPGSLRVPMFGPTTANPTAASFALSCYPIWTDPTTRVPWTIRITKPAGAAVLRLEWSRNGGGL